MGHWHLQVRFRLHLFQFVRIVNSATMKVTWIAYIVHAAKLSTIVMQLVVCTLILYYLHMNPDSPLARQLHLLLNT